MIDGCRKLGMLFPTFFFRKGYFRSPPYWVVIGLLVELSLGCFFSYCLLYLSSLPAYYAGVWGVTINIT